MRIPFGLGKHVSLEYIDIEVALGSAGMHVGGLVGWMSKIKCWRMSSKQPRKSIAEGSRIMFWARMSQMTVSLMVVMPVVGCWVGFAVVSELFFPYFFRCESHWPLRFR